MPLDIAAGAFHFHCLGAFPDSALGPVSPGLSATNTYLPLARRRRILRNTRLSGAVYGPGARTAGHARLWTWSRIRASGVGGVRGSCREWDGGWGKPCCGRELRLEGWGLERWERVASGMFCAGT